jgi:hypothetical protein
MRKLFVDEKQNNGGTRVVKERIRQQMENAENGD